MGAMLSWPKPGPNPSMLICRGHESMSCPNARGPFADCSMLSGLGAWQYPAVVRARKHGIPRLDRAVNLLPAEECLKRENTGFDK